MDKQDITTSKLLSLWLRHDPAAAGLTLDEAGWTDIDSVVVALSRVRALEWEDLVRVVENNDKQRFELNPAATRIRARQGHSVDVKLDWPVAEPPPSLFHGTPERFLKAIMDEGLRPMARHDVHLSADQNTARQVGARRGKPVILAVDAAGMRAHGHEFRLTGNGVWLTTFVPTAFLSKVT